MLLPILISLVFSSFSTPSVASSDSIFVHPVEVFSDEGCREGMNKVSMPDIGMELCYPDSWEEGDVVKAKVILLSPFENV